jgi:polar amino acid transport system substrate-binding protein
LTESNDDLYLALSSAKIDVVVDDSPIATYFSRLMPGLCVVGLLPKTEATYAIMVRKGNRTLRDAVNRVLNDMQRDGTLSKFRATWLE